jgi:hypothetical protein
MSDLSDAINRSASAQNTTAIAQGASAVAQAAAAYQMGKVAEAQREANELTKLKLLEEQEEKERRIRAKALRIACLESRERLEQLERLISSETDENMLLKEALFPSVYIPLTVQIGKEVFEEFQDLERIKELTAFLKRLDIPLSGMRVNLLDLPERIKAYTRPFYKAADDFLSRCEDIESLAKKNNNISLNAPEIWTDKIPSLEKSALRLFEETEKIKNWGLLITEEGITDVLAPAKTLLAQEGNRPVLDQLKEKKFSFGFPEKSLGVIFSSIKTDFDDLTQKTTSSKKNYLALAKQAKAAANDKDKTKVKKILREIACLEMSFADVENEVFARVWLNNYTWPVWKKILIGLGMFLGGGTLIAALSLEAEIGSICMIGLLIGIPIWLSKK